MFIPTQSQPSTEANTSNYDFGVECPYGTKYHCMAFLLAFMLVFYALALWDRYIVLKFKEHEKLELRMRYARLASLPSPPNYGSMESFKRTNNYLTVPPNDRALFGERLPPVTSKIHQTQKPFCLTIPVPSMKTPSA